MTRNRAHTAKVWACTDCMLVHANGECDPDRPAELPEPLCLVDGPDRITMGILAEEHADGCDYGQPGYEECDCDHDSFSQSSCDLCGDDHHGERHAFTWWFTDAEVAKEGWY